MEKPGVGGGLPFLDMNLSIDERNCVVYEWCQKDLHSGFLMHKCSFFSSSQKWHFMINRFVAIFGRCNTSAGVNKGVKKMHAQLIENGYKLEEVNRSLVIAVQKYNNPSTRASGLRNSVAGSVPSPLQKKVSAGVGHKAPRINIREHMGVNPLKLPFISDEFHRRARKLVNDLNLPLKVVYQQSRQIKQLGANPVPPKKCATRCQVCLELPEKLNCRLGNVVYEAVCRRCGEQNIGKTSRNLYSRLSQHKSELSHMDPRGPLPSHLREHGATSGGLADFQFDVVARAKGKIETTIKEALCIDCFGPAINRKEERQFFI